MWLNAELMKNAAGELSELIWALRKSADWTKLWGKKYQVLIVLRSRIYGIMGKRQGIRINYPLPFAYSLLVYQYIQYTKEQCKCKQNIDELIVLYIYFFDFKSYECPC